MSLRMRLPETRRLRFAQMLFVLLLGISLIAALGVACGGSKVEPEPDPAPGTPKAGVVQTPPPGAATLEVTLKEWSITTDQPTVAAGKVYFLTTNAGGEAHEMVVIRTNLATDALPETNGKVPEGDVDMIGEISPFSPGSKASTALDLKSGNYVLICNVVETVNGERVSHYLKGMRTEFTVQ